MDRHIKIITTLGPATQSEEQIRQLVHSGAKIFRLNFSHGDKEFFRERVEIIRKLEEETGYTLTILQDLSGPKVRTSDVGKGTLDISKGTEVLLGTCAMADKTDEPFICLDIPEMLEVIKEGDSVALSDGMLRFTAIKRESEHLVRLRAINSGIAPPRKGIAFPGKVTPLDAMTEKDKVDLAFGMELGVDCVALSYVQTADDLLVLKAEMDKLGRRLPIITKLETTAAIDNLDSILDETDGVMVARGDLGLEMNLAELPATQKRIIRECNKRGMPVIVATQMLLSMVKTPMATRAETTDVANAILDGADCIMLSEETAIGSYPCEAVQFMRTIAYEIERFYFEQRQDVALHPGDLEHPATYLAYAAAMLAGKTNAKGLVCHSTSGATARILSSCRPKQSVYALTSDTVARHFCNLSWGVIPGIPDTSFNNHQERAEDFVKNHPAFEAGDTIIIAAGQPDPAKDATKTQTNVVKLFVK